MSQKSPILYIQGIRGLAIILIILFHLCPGVCPNGFFGVDSFLVLSGYFLIGKQLQPGAEFSFLAFVRKKGLRLFPPMLVICFFMTMVASLLPDFAMKEILQQVQWALLCIPNIKLAAATNDYFAADTRHMPLMHLWYMGCIIQCYLFFALLFVIWKIGHFSQRGKLISLGVVSFVSLAVQHQSLIYTFGWGGSEYLASTYYLTTARLWEVAIGGALVLIPDFSSRLPRVSSVLSALAGLGLCIIPFLPLGDGTQYIFLAVLLTSVLLLCKECGPFVRFLSLPPLVFIGSISFSLYLVHWPVICLPNCYFGIAVSPISAAAEIATMAVLGFALYRLAEKRSYHSITIGGMYLVCWGILALFSMTGSMRAYCTKNVFDIELLPYNMEVAEIDKELYTHAEGLPVQWDRQDGQQASLIYHLGDTSKPANFVLLGDSHSENLVSGFDIIGKEKGWSGVYLNSYFHPFWGSLYVAAAQPKHTFDQAKGEAFLRWFEAHPGITHIIIAQCWDPRFRKHKRWNGESIEQDEERIFRSRYEELKKLCELLQAQGKTVVLLTDNPGITGTNPQQYVLSKRLRGDNKFDDAEYICTREDYLKNNARFLRCATMLEQEGKCLLIHMGEALLNEGNGTFYAMKGNKLLMKDGSHLSYMGGLEAIRLIADEFLNTISKH